MCAFLESEEQSGRSGATALAVLRNRLGCLAPRDAAEEGQ